MKDINKVLKKKLAKERDIFDAAYNLFSTKGINDTAIDDIVKKAGVAKGTFYLYFKDKYDIVDKIIFSKSAIVIKNAIKITQEENLDSFSDQLIFFINYIIEYLKSNRILLKLIYKNLSWGLFRKAISNPEHNKEIADIFNYFIMHMKSEHMDEGKVEKTLFLIIELTGSVCYSSIILGEPDSIDNMKPLLFETIIKIISP